MIRVEKTVYCIVFYSPRKKSDEFSPLSTRSKWNSECDPLSTLKLVCINIALIETSALVYGNLSLLSDFGCKCI